MAQVLRRLTPSTDPALLAGTDDDAAVYRLSHDMALIFTTDFFTPIVDDARDWGRIAAANALSDVYAMGGEPLMCLNIAGWPRDVLPLDLLGDVLAGGEEVVREAGAIVAGGHTIDDPEPKYGMAVVGRAHPDHIMTTEAGKVGDVLVLTKPIGTGVITTALKAGVAPPDVLATAVWSMTVLNARASRVAVAHQVRAATDITGFGLLGHLHRLCKSSGVAARISSAAVPLLPGARTLAEAGHIAGGTKRNLEFVSPFVTSSAPDIDLTLMADAQTSGGLLLCVPEARADALEAGLAAAGVEPARIGSLIEGEPGSIALS